MTFDGELTAREMLEGAVHAGASIQPLWSKALAALGPTVAALAILATGVALLHIRFAGAEGLPLWVVALAALAAFGWTIGIPQAVHRSIHARVVAAPFQQGMRVTFGPEGIVHDNGRSRWSSDWRDVTDVRRTKRTVTAVVSGIALPVSLRHVGDPDALMAAIEEWRAAT